MEIALITWLSFVDTLAEAEIKEHISNEHLIEKYFNDGKITFDVLEKVLEECEDPEDVYKQDLCYLVEGVLNAPERTVPIWRDMVKFVMVLDIFFSSMYGADFRTRS